MNLQKQFTNTVQKQDASTVEELLTLFDQCEAINSEAMLGQWSGGLLPSGHAGEAQLAAMQWVGKNFNDINDVNPIVVAGKGQSRQVSDVMGGASLRQVTYRDVTSATMIYDNNPTFDYFRKVDADTVMGVMDHKGDAQPLFFYLQRLSE